MSEKEKIRLLSEMGLWQRRERGESMEDLISRCVDEDFHEFMSKSEVPVYDL